jgi:alkylation response protein AidB-like acyl-CoA dehydrogenase
MTATTAAGPTTPPTAELSLEGFRASARDFLDRHVPLRRKEGPFEWGQGPDAYGLFEDAPSPAETAEACAWRRTVFDAGFGAITVPTPFGGRGLPGAYERVYQTEERRYETPASRLFHIGLGMVAPTLLAHGTDAARARHVRSMYRGDVIGCQLFSEPGAGSDLAGVTTRAERDGDEWIIDGQKVWTSVAQIANIGLLVARTAPGPRHRNLTAFILDMDQPGVDVRPLRQMTGGAAFNEVFLTGARIPDDQRLGDVDGGWRVVLTTLMHERSAVGGPAAGGSGILSSARLLAMARHFGVDRDPVLRQELASALIHLRVSHYTRLRSEAARRAGQPPGPQASTGKLALTTNLQRVSALVSRILGARLVADTGEWGTYAWTEFVLGVPGLRLGGGTDEIVRNILAERVLALPKDSAP